MKLSDTTDLLPKDETRAFEVFDTIRAFNTVHSRYMNMQDGVEYDDMYHPIGKITLFINKKNEINEYRCVYIWYVQNSMSDELQPIIRREGLRNRKLTCEERDKKLIKYIAESSGALKVKKEATTHGSKVNPDEWDVYHFEMVEDNGNDRIMPMWKKDYL